MKVNNPYFVVILIQTIYSAMILLSKAAFDHGMNTFIFVFYRQATATLFLTPFTFFFEWKTAPPMPFWTFCKIFFLSLVGITLTLDIYGIGLIYTSVALAAATSNSLPAITFFLALLLRFCDKIKVFTSHKEDNISFLANSTFGIFGIFWFSKYRMLSKIESLKIKTTPGIAKLIGIVACLAGAATLAFYKGPPLKFLSHYHLLDYHKTLQHKGHAPSGAWIKGCFLMLLSNTCFGLWFVLQAFIIKVYPSKLLFTTIQCFLSSIQSLAIALAVERDIEQWKLGWNTRLLAVLYCGIMVTGVTYYLQTWVIQKKGPVFLAMSTPLVLIITIFASATILGEIISLGSVLGGFVLILGLYSVLWGKSKEHIPKATLDEEQASG